jgi:predicted phosphodiesterase
MDNFQVESDIHIDTNKDEAIKTIKPFADNLILAGDIGQPLDPYFELFIKHVASNWKNVIYITGNHEYYDSYGIMTIKKVNDTIENMFSKYPNVHFLNNSKIIIDGITIIGSTLWSSPISDTYLKDFRINISDDNGYININTFRKMNTESIQFLETELENCCHAKTIVVTHFMPLMNIDIPNSKYKSNPINDSYFGNKLYHLINKPKFWISGHTHQRFEIDIKDTKWLCNPMGQKYEKIEHKLMTFHI